MQKLLFELPQEPIQVAQLVREIPNGFSYFDGYLIAPKSAYDQQRVAKNTRLVIGRFSSIKPTIVGQMDRPFEECPELSYRRDGEPRIDPNYVDLFTNAGLVSSVSFDQSGFDGLPQRLSEIKRLVEHFITKGYKGVLAAYKNYDDGERYQTAERVKFTHVPGERMYFTSDLPAHISLEWDNSIGGSLAGMSGLLTSIERLDLRSIPVPKRM